MSGLYALLAAMLQLAVGLLFAAVVTDWRAEVTRGFLALTGGTALVIGLLAFGLGGLLRVDGAERLLQGLLVVGLLVYTLLLSGAGRPRRLPVGASTLLLGLAALAVAGIARPSASIGPALTVAAFLLAALALGAGSAGMLLGHWYLVTPGLTSRPLRLLCDLLLASLAPLTVLAAWYLQARAESGAIFGGLGGAAAWVGAAMITLFPLGVTIAARVCCVDGPGRGRSLQAATGLLYLVAAAVLAGGLAGNAVLLGT